MDHGRGAICTNNEVRSHAEQIPATAIANKIVRDQTETLGDFKVAIERASASGLGGGYLRDGIEEPHRALDAGDFEMHMRIGIEGELGQDVGMDIGGCYAAAHVLVELPNEISSLEESRQNRYAAAAGPAEVLGCVFSS